MEKFKWPNKIKSDIVLKDILEDKVDEKYYLSNERIEAISKWNAQQDPFGNMKKSHKNGYFGALTTREWDTTSGMKLVKEVIKNKKLLSKKFQQENIVSSKEDKVIPTITSTGAFSGHKIIENVFESGHHGGKLNDLRIRKITPREALRLMGMDDKRIDLIQKSKLISHNKQYFVAGNSIVIPVLEAIFKNINLPKDRPLKIFETFSGYGSQMIALENLGYKIDKESAISEWFIDAIISYALIHHNDNFWSLYNQHSTWNKNKYLEEINGIGTMHKPYTISLDSKKPSSLKNLSLEKLKALSISNFVSNNKGSIIDIKAKDLTQYDLLTYSFPCQDLSLAGKSKGMKKGDSTRSGLLWEIERLLLELKELDKLPKVLFMENVPQIHSKLHNNDFNKWQLSLQELGYTNTWKDLNAKDFGVPQNRNRTYMVSILNGEVEDESLVQLSLF